MSVQDLEDRPPEAVPIVSRASTGIARLRRLIVPALAVTAAILALLVLPPWLRLLIPRWVIRGANIAFLETLLVALGLSLPTFGLGLIASILVLVICRARGTRAGVAAAGRCALLCGSVLVGLSCMEFSTTIMRQRKYRLPDLPTRFNEPARIDPADEKIAFVPPLPASGAGHERTNRTISLAVVGESSARGEPYHPWVSVGQLVTWQLQSVFPDAEVRVEILAEGGLCLEQAINLVYEVRQKPDALLVFAGHNEFQARFGWSRN